MGNGKKKGNGENGEPHIRLPKIARMGHGNPNPPPPPKEYQFKKGQSGNPGGRPKLLKAAYAAWLAQPNERQPNLTNSEVVAQSLGRKALRGDVVVARELRAGTEGERITVVWQSELVQLIQQGVLTAQELQAELGPEEARAILIAAGTQGLGIPELKMIDSEAVELPEE